MTTKLVEPAAATIHPFFSQFPMATKKTVRVLFVCTGNICRSPTAEGVFRALVEKEGLGDRIIADSAATHSYHIGSKPDHRSIAAAKRRGVDLSKLRARKVVSTDFETFDLVLAMDEGHHRILSRLCPKTHLDRLKMFLEFAPEFGVEDVPDPYYGDADTFEVVLDMSEAGSQGILRFIQQNLLK